MPTLAALALALADAPEAAPGRRLVPLIDGRRREVFAAVFEAAPAAACARPRTSPWCRPTASPSGSRAAATSSWAATAPSLYGELLPASARRAAGVVAPTAAMVGRAVACGAPGLVRGPDAVLPIYGRAPDAKPRRGAAPPAGGAS